MKTITILRSPDGRALVSTGEGHLMLDGGKILPGAPERQLVLIAGTGQNATPMMLVSAYPVTLLPGSPARSYWALHREGGEETATFTVGLDGPSLVWDGPVLQAGGTPHTAFFEIVPLDVTDGQGIWFLPSSGCFDRQGLSEILDKGDAAFLPVLEALLPAMKITDVRTAWAEAAPAPARDVFFDLVKAEIIKRMDAHHPFTADTLAEMADAYGWSIGAHTYGALANPTIVLGNHALDTATTYPFVDLWRFWPSVQAGMQDHTSKDVVTGHDVWIGVDAVILPGATIGDGAVIGAGAVVRGTVPPYAICTGNPATIRRYRFDEETICRLLALEWWHWPDARVDRYLPLIVDDGIAHFLEKAEAETARS